MQSINYVQSIAYVNGLCPFYSTQYNGIVGMESG